jgi:molybdopterin molybdotransferase
MGAEFPSYAEADAVVASFARELSRVRPAAERVALSAAPGRVLAEPIVADEDQPQFARSTRDGYACRAGEAMAQRVLRIAGTTHAGEAPSGPLPAGAVWEIMTGAPVPADADAVVMVEHADGDGDSVRLHSNLEIKPGDNVVARGAQARRGDELESW